MASIDHTCIYFHNGMLMKEISHCEVKSLEKNLVKNSSV